MYISPSHSRFLSILPQHLALVFVCNCNRRVVLMMMVMMMVVVVVVVVT